MDQVLHLQPISLIVMSPPLAPGSSLSPQYQCLKAGSDQTSDPGTMCPAADAPVPGHLTPRCTYLTHGQWPQQALSGSCLLLRIFLITNVKLEDLNLDLVS